VAASADLHQATKLHLTAFPTAAAAAAGMQPLLLLLLLLAERIVRQVLEGQL
jgi:hypothetical protein